MADYIVRTLTEDCEIESEITYDWEDEAWEGFQVVCMHTFDTESLFYPGDPYWTVQLIHMDAGPFDTGTVLAETNSVLESLGKFEPSFGG